MEAELSRRGFLKFASLVADKLANGPLSKALSLAGEVEPRLLGPELVQIPSIQLDLAHAEAAGFGGEAEAGDPFAVNRFEERLFPLDATVEQNLPPAFARLTFGRSATPEFRGVKRIGFLQQEQRQSFARVLDDNGQLEGAFIMGSIPDPEQNSLIESMEPLDGQYAFQVKTTDGKTRVLPLVVNKPLECSASCEPVYLEVYRPDEHGNEHLEVACAWINGRGEVETIEPKSKLLDLGEGGRVDIMELSNGRYGWQATDGNGVIQEFLVLGNIPAPESTATAKPPESTATAKPPESTATAKPPESTATAKPPEPTAKPEQPAGSYLEGTHVTTAFANEYKQMVGGNLDTSFVNRGSGRTAAEARARGAFFDKRQVLMADGTQGIWVVAGEVIKVENGKFYPNIKAGSLNVTLKLGDGRTAKVEVLMSSGAVVTQFEFARQGNVRYPWIASRENQALRTIQEGDWFGAVCGGEEDRANKMLQNQEFVKARALGITS